MKFNCSGCQECCKRIGYNLPKLREFGFPYSVNEKGWCEKLTYDGKCSVYSKRPDICNVDKTFYLIHSKSGKTKKEVFLNEAKICNSFIREAGLDEKYLIDENRYK